MRPIPWVLSALLALAFQVSPRLTTVSAQSSPPLLPHAVQGPGATTPLDVGQTVTVRGVITANRADSLFFIQTESGLEDADANTSEGLFVAHETMLGVTSVVLVTGTVEEFDDFGAGTVTRLTNVTDVVFEGIASSLPDAVVLSPADLLPNGSLEHLEGMRVSVPSLTAVSGIDLDGAFFAVLGNTLRPFREPGIDVSSPLLCAAGPCQPTFDGNPERLRVHSDALASTAAPLFWPAGLVRTNVAGVLHFEAGAYTLLPESSLPWDPSDPSDNPAERPVRATGESEFSIASLNLGEFSDVDMQQTKASLMVRGVLNAPDIVVVHQADPGALDALAALIDEDALADNQTAPGYVAYLDGFLVKSSRVAVDSDASEVLGADEPFEDGLLFERAPAVLFAVVSGGENDEPQPLAVLNSQLRSIAGVEGTDDFARRHRRAQAEWLWRFARDHQQDNSTDKLVLVGNFNAHAFNDGYVDVVGTILGTPALPDQVVLDSQGLFPLNLVNLTGGLAAAERYNSVARGNAQALDHTLVASNLAGQVRDFALARVNADFAELWRFVDTDARGLSDRDPSVAFFAFPSDVTAPVFDFTPQPQTAEAAGPSGATVDFVPPLTATDDVDGEVTVNCAPSSGTVFALGTTNVRCWAADAAGNEAEVFFDVVVEDNTAPSFPSTPADIEVPASNGNGAVVTFSAPAATDTVDQNVTVTCEPPSGSWFEVGTTAVACTAVDDAGNYAVTGFSVTVTTADSLPGHVTGNGELLGTSRVNFVFNVKETRTHVDRGWVVVHVENRKGKNDRYLVGVVTDAVFTNAAEYNPGTGPTNGVDTVVFSGVGCWSGKSGHTFEITASDRGEPGRGLDTFTVVIKKNGQVVESATGTLHRGNIQSRRR
jgi:hypothetical protein